MNYICAKKWHIGIQTLTRTLGNWLFVKMCSGKGHVFHHKSGTQKIKYFTYEERRSIWIIWILQQISFSVWVLLKSCNWATHYGVLLLPLLIRVGVAKYPMDFTTCVTPFPFTLSKKFKQGTSIAFKEDFWHGHLEQLWTSMCQLHWPSRCTITSNLINGVRVLYPVILLVPYIVTWIFHILRWTFQKSGNNSLN